MKPFQYVTARSVEAALEHAADRGRYFAGGIDLLGELKEEIAEARILVNVKELPGTRGIAPGPDRWVLGANVTVAEVARHPQLRAVFPGLAEAAAEVGSPQIRNVATVGGNLAQHSRCWYYRHRDLRCLKRGGSTCHAREGLNRHHSLFTGNPCVSPVVSNLAVALAALDATVIVQRRGQELAMSIAELYDAAWENPLSHHSLRAGDLILRVEVPTGLTCSAYMQCAEKSDFDWALVSCAAAAELAGGTVRRARIALGAVAPVPHQPEAANEFLAGKPLDEETAAAAAELILRDADPLGHNAFKVPMAHALIRRTLLRLGSPTA